jgi:hypothetical protein
LAINVTTASGAGTTARAGIYTCNENGYPSVLLATTGDLDTSTTGMKVGTLANSIVLPPGWYFTAVVCSGTPTISAYTSNASNVISGNPLGLSSASSAMDFRSEAVGSAILPSNASLTTNASAVGTQHTPLIYLGVQ